MSTFYGLDTSDSLYSSMFGSATNNSSAPSAGGVGDLALINSGAYKKLLNAYYSKDSKEVDEAAEKKEKVNLSTANQNASALADSVSRLMDIEITEENRESVKEELKTLIEKYNSLIDSSSSVDDTTVLRNAVWMTRGTSTNAGLLTDIGVTIGEGNKLSLDEEKFDKAQLTTLQSLTSGKDSFVGRLGSRAGIIATAAANAVSGSAGAGYTSSGKGYSAPSVSSVIDSLT